MIIDNLLNNLHADNRLHAAYIRLLKTLNSNAFRTKALKEAEKLLPK